MLLANRKSLSKQTVHILLTARDLIGKEKEKEDGGFVAKKPRDSDSEAIDAIAEAQDVIDAAVEDDTIQSNDFDDDYDDEEDDDYDDLVFFINYCSHFKLV